MLSAMLNALRLIVRDSGRIPLMLLIWLSLMIV
jgi:hypothetical protein